MHARDIGSSGPGVRRSLFKLANGGNIAAAIFLAKNLLGYRDVVNTEHSSPGGSPIEIATKPDLAQSSDDPPASRHC